MHSFQATCIRIDNRALLIEGAPGTGKSSLALALIDRGAMLIGDDSVLLDTQAGKLTASPHPNTQGLLEIRGLGLITMPISDVAPVALAIRLATGAPRYIERPDTIERLGIPLPLVTLEPDSANLPIRAEIALRTFGLTFP